MNQYLGMLGCIIIDLSYFYLSLVLGFKNRFYQCRCRLAIRNFYDRKRTIIDLLDFSAYFHAAASFPIVIFRNIYKSTCLKIGVQMKLLAPQISHSRL